MSEEVHEQPAVDDEDTVKETRSKRRKAADTPQEAVPAAAAAAAAAAEEPDFTSGQVHLADLRIGTRNSDSVRRLQTALGTNVTGTYDRGTQMAVRSWQRSNGFEGGRGIQVGSVQAERLFGDNYTVVDSYA